jgi:hypothetical protein
MEKRADIKSKIAIIRWHFDGGGIDWMFVICLFFVHPLHEEDTV